MEVEVASIYTAIIEELIILDKSFGSRVVQQAY